MNNYQTTHSVHLRHSNFQHLFEREWNRVNGKATNEAASVKISSLSRQREISDSETVSLEENLV